MADFNLDEMSLPELKKLQTQVGNAIKSYEDRKKKTALAELEAKAQEMGFSLSELTGTSVRKGKVNPPNYRNPENPSETWSGRGRQPGWIKAAVARGDDLETYLIVK